MKIAQFFSQTGHKLFSGQLQHGSPAENHLFEHEQILAIKSKACRDEPPQELFDKVCEHQLLGLQASRFKGSGMEYEELRLFQRGDDFRHIHWRALAKTGLLYSKLFVEERRPALYILLDRRPGMWFGTRNQLKITQAAAIAYYYVFLANNANRSVAGLLCGEQMSYFKPAQGESLLLPLIQEINQSFSPVSMRPPQQENVKFSHLLKFALNQFPNGSSVIMIGDFHDYRESNRELLYELEKFQQLAFIQVLDPAELELPETGSFIFRDMNPDSEVQLNCDNETFRRQYQQQMAEKWELLQEHCRLLGIDYKRVMTTQEWLSGD